MALDNFRTIELIWDKANKSIVKTIKTASSDNTGRYLSVKVLDDGQEADLTGAKLQLYWEHPNFNTTGIDNFTAVDSKGLFTLTFSKEMLTNVGELNAHLVLTLSDGKITSDGFPIQVFKGADGGVVVPTNGRELINQIDNKIDKRNVTMGDLTQEVKLAMTGGSVAVVDVDAVGTENVKDKSITIDKTNFGEMVKNNLLTGYTISNGYLGSDGVTFVGSSAYRSPKELIPVSPNTTYGHNFYNLNIYDANRNIIRVVGSATINGKGTYTTGATTHFVSPIIENAAVPVGSAYFYDLTNSSIIFPNLTLIHEQNKEIEFVDINILDDFNYVTGYYIPNGLNPDAKYYTTTDLIPVSSGKTYEHNFYNINLYGSNGAMLRAAGSASVNGKGSYTIPSDTRYIRPTIRLSDVPMGNAYLYLSESKYFKINGLVVTDDNLLKSSNEAVYVSTNGSDSNTGAKSSPFKTISKAIESGAETINIQRGKYVGQFTAVTDKLILNAYGDSEEDVIVTGADTLSNWTAYNRIYKQPYTQNNKHFTAVFIAKTQQPIITGARSDTYGATIWEGNNGVDDYKMKPVLTLSECEAEVGTFYYDGTDVYINPQNIANEFNAVRLDGNAIVANELKMNDIKFDFYNNETIKLDNVKNLEVNNVEFNHSVRADGVSIDRTNGTFNNSKAFKNRNDGFNLHYKGATVFNNCYGINNYDDGISHHESCEGIINGGVWSGNGKGGISPAYGAKVNWYNCILENNAYGIFGESYDGVENISSGNLYKGNTVDIRATNGKILSFNDKFLDGAPKLEGAQRITVY